MVCNRCIKVVRDELTRLGHLVVAIELGRVELVHGLSVAQIDRVRTVLDENGFELIDDKKSQLIDRIKTLIIERIHYHDEGVTTDNPSDYIVKELGYDYSYLSNLFSSVEGITIEKYSIRQKIERVKELLVYNELSLKEIAYLLNYSSVQHLSNQFRKVTGLSPTQFKALKEPKRKPLDQV